MRFRVCLAVLVLMGIVAQVRAAEREGGTFTGTVVEKGEGWLRVKPAEGESERFMARWIGGMPKDGGGLDRAMVEKIAATPVGAKVRLKWIFEERKRVVELEQL